MLWARVTTPNGDHLYDGQVIPMGHGFFAAEPVVDDFHGFMLKGPLVKSHRGTLVIASAKGFFGDARLELTEL